MDSQTGLTINMQGSRRDQVIEGMNEYKGEDEAMGHKYVWGETQTGIERYVLLGIFLPRFCHFLLQFNSQRPVPEFSSISGFYLLPQSVVDTTTLFLSHVVQISWTMFACYFLHTKQEVITMEVTFVTYCELNRSPGQVKRVSRRRKWRRKVTQKDNR